MSVVVDGAAAGAPEGTIGWIGGYGTKWQSNPATGLTTILLTQRVFESPEPPPVFEAFEQGAGKVLPDLRVPIGSATAVDANGCEVWALETMSGPFRIAPRASQPPSSSPPRRTRGHRAS